MFSTYIYLTALFFNLIVHKPSFSLIFAFFQLNEKNKKIIQFDEYAITIVNITHLV